LISNEYTNRLVHKWRSEEMAIVVGTNTALSDDPQLSTRNWPGKNPIRVVVDMNLRLPSTLQLFNGNTTTLVFNKHRHTLPFEKISISQLRDTGLAYYQVTEDVSLVHQLLNGLYQLGIQSILVEGGTKLLQSFLDEGLWDEARVICNEQLVIGNGLPAPQLHRSQLLRAERIFSDSIRYYHNSQS
jgi:diaminohydroxyphosphoribosylaminopyrimidine deaminase / 5-amino-6-(5-phosphoribosylamino)uracil reductase